MAFTPAVLASDKKEKTAPKELVTATVLERLLDVRLPLIGHLPLQRQIRILLILVGAAFLLSVFFAWQNMLNWAQGTIRIQIAGDAVMHSQRIGKAAPNAVQGNQEAFMQLADSRRELSQDLTLLAKGGNYQGAAIAAPDARIAASINANQALWIKSEKAADAILQRKKELTGFGATLQNLNHMSAALLVLSEHIATLKVQSGASAREILAAGQLMMLTQRLGRSASAFHTAEGADAETAFLLGKDTNTFRDIVDGLLSGSDTLKLPAEKNPETRAKLIELQTEFAQYQQSVTGILENIESFIAAKQAEQLLFKDNEALKQRISGLLDTFRAARDDWGLSFWLLLSSALVALLTAIGVGMLLLQDSRSRTREAESRRQEAELQQHLSQTQEEQAKHTNDQNQAAILRLMNELQEVADGDLTVQATVSEDITGAIADSVNYTVEELRLLVGRVTNTAEHVTTASNQAHSMSADLLVVSQQQSQEIESAGQSVLQMAQQITDVSRSASQSAEVARQSVTAAEQGSRAVENAIKGMTEIREQIQETSKRIKRLGESSQEIGEIIELISDITEQTNVLALNAAIQAASAGEAGRGFSVVAEEVQRLAERSGAATKQIGALVRTIQTDTLDAVAAMEKSTQGVVEGAKLSDAAGAALTDISHVSNRLADLIQGISNETEQQATSANGVAHTIQHILAVTEQTTGGTQQTAQSIQQLSLLAEELKNSVSRFRIVA